MKNYIVNNGCVAKHTNTSTDKTLQAKEYSEY